MHYPHNNTPLVMGYFHNVVLISVLARCFIADASEQGVRFRLGQHDVFCAKA